jgi:tetratricopeptide (TPR) repeat protein
LKKELKKSIKEDEFLSGLEVAWSWWKANEKVARLGVGALVLVLAAVSVFSMLRGRRERAVNVAFDAAMRVYETPLAAEVQETPPPGVMPFANARDKYTKAAAAFDGVERAHPTHLLGRRARYYAALCRLELGDSDAALKALKALADGAPAGTLEGALARIAVADASRRAGSLDRAVESYRALVDEAALGMPRDYVLMSLASTLESAQRTTEAVASYRRLYEEFPDSVYAPEAQRRAAYLKPESRG